MASAMNSKAAWAGTVGMGGEGRREEEREEELGERKREEGTWG